jgi:FkbM family methyltransferase
MDDNYLGLWRRVALGYSRAELPGWGKLLTMTRVLGTQFDADWVGHPVVAVRGKTHGYLMKLDLSDWAQRMTFFLGRYYEIGVQRALSLILKPGDTFVDIGANIGMITMHARSIVGAEGFIHAFEPIPECATQIREHLSINDIANVQLHNCALSDSAGTLAIQITSDHTGTATLASVALEDVRRTVSVDVRIGDNELHGPVDVIKIDVEGFELHVLKGLSRTIGECTPTIITELIEAQLANAGTSVAEVSQFLYARGYSAYGLGSRRRGFRHKLELLPIEEGGRAPQGINDVVWIHPNCRIGLRTY